MKIPSEALLATDSGDVRLQFVTYRTSQLFRSHRTMEAVRGQPGLIVSATVSGHNISELENPVVYTMPTSTGGAFYSCVFWDESCK